MVFGGAYSLCSLLKFHEGMYDTKALKIANDTLIELQKQMILHILTMIFNKSAGSFSLNIVCHHQTEDE